MSIRWLRNIVIDNIKTTLEIQMGDKRIGDKCYVRVNKEKEKWFNANSSDRNNILNDGIKILKERFSNSEVKYENGKLFDWK